MSIKDRVEQHPVVFFLGTIIVGFVAGFGTLDKLNSMSLSKKESLNNAGSTQPKKLTPSFIESQIASLTTLHNERMEKLHSRYLYESEQSTYGGNLDSRQLKHRKAAEDLTKQINKEKEMYIQQIQSLRSVDCLIKEKT